MLAVDNLSGGRVAGRVVSVNHVDNYKVKRAEVLSKIVPAKDSMTDHVSQASRLIDRSALGMSQLLSCTGMLQPLPSRLRLRTSYMRE